MPDWTTFIAFAVVTTLLVLALARASQSVLTEYAASDPDRDLDSEDAVVGDVDPTPFSTASLFANVVVSQGAFLLLILLSAWLFEIPAWAFGAGEATTGVEFVAAGVAAGAVLYVANEAAAAVGKRRGFTGSEELRRRLAPDSVPGWAALLLVVLPTIAVFEELLFRGALIGVVAAGVGVSPWLPAIVSSAAFGFGHGAQGKLGVVVTGLLGFALAALYVASGSLLLVIVAHYVVNVLEFLVHEGLGWEPFESGR